MINSEEYVSLQIDNNCYTDLAHYSEMATAEGVVALWNIAGSLNKRINDLERDVRLLQQPSGSTSWAKR